MTGLEQHVLRYWEQEFPKLRPKKNRAGNRQFREKDITTIKYIKHLLHNEQYTVAGARKKLQDAGYREVEGQVDLLSAIMPVAPLYTTASAQVDGSTSEGNGFQTGAPDYTSILHPEPVVARGRKRKKDIADPPPQKDDFNRTDHTVLGDLKVSGTPQTSPLFLLSGQEPDYSSERQYALSNSSPIFSDLTVPEREAWSQIVQAKNSLLKQIIAELKSTRQLLS